MINHRDIGFLYYGVGLGLMFSLFNNTNPGTVVIPACLFLALALVSFLLGDRK